VGFLLCSEVTFSFFPFFDSLGPWISILFLLPPVAFFFEGHWMASFLDPRDSQNLSENPFYLHRPLKFPSPPLSFCRTPALFFFLTSFSDRRVFLRAAIMFLLAPPGPYWPFTKLPPPLFFSQTRDDMGHSPHHQTSFNPPSQTL